MPAEFCKKMFGSLRAAAEKEGLSLSIRPAKVNEKRADFRVSGVNGKVMESISNPDAGEGLSVEHVAAGKGWLVRVKPHPLKPFTSKVQRKLSNLQF